MNSEVVVSGMGILSAIGCGKQAFMEGLRQASCGIHGNVALRCGKPSPTPYGVVADLDLLCAKYLDAARLRRWDPVSRMTYLACVLALRDAELLDEENHWIGVDPKRIGLVMATGYGGLESTENLFRKVAEDSPQTANPSLFPETVPNAATGHLSIELGLKGPNTTFTQRQISTEAALHFALNLMEKSDLDFVITGAIEDLAEWGMISQLHCGVLAKGKAPSLHPFDRKRSGTLLGEGGAIFILERRERAAKRGVKAYGQILAKQIAGVPATHGSWPKGASAAAALLKNVRHFFEDHSIQPNDLSYVSACALGDPCLDQLEATFLHEAIGNKTPISALSGATGSFLCHSSLRLAASFLSLQERFIPATVGLTDPDGATLNHVMHKSQALKGNSVLLHTLADGGGQALTLVHRNGEKHA